MRKYQTLHDFLERVASADRAEIVPSGCRPSNSGTLIFMTGNNNNMCRIDIAANDNVTATTDSAGWISLDGISFGAD